MERYDYEKAVIDDVERYIKDHYDTEELKEEFEDRRRFEDKLYDDLRVEDSVTGNASGSYTFNAWKAEEYVCNNLDLLGEACEEFCCGPDILKKGAESCDVTIRCYLLPNAIRTALDHIEEELDNFNEI